MLYSIFIRWFSRTCQVNFTFMPCFNGGMYVPAAQRQGGEWGWNVGEAVLLIAQLLNLWLFDQNETNGDFTVVLKLILLLFLYINWLYFRMCLWIDLSLCISNSKVPFKCARNVPRPLCNTALDCTGCLEYPSNVRSFQSYMLSYRRLSFEPWQAMHCLPQCNYEIYAFKTIWILLSRSY